MWRGVRVLWRGVVWRGVAWLGGSVVACACVQTCRCDAWASAWAHACKGACPCMQPVHAYARVIVAKALVQP